MAERREKEYSCKTFKLHFCAPLSTVSSLKLLSTKIRIVWCCNLPFLEWKLLYFRFSYINSKHFHIRYILWDVFWWCNGYVSESDRRWSYKVGYFSSSSLIIHARLGYSSYQIISWRKRKWRLYVSARFCVYLLQYAKRLFSK